MTQSAKALFRATGNVSTDTSPREEHDFYATPYDVTRAFLAAEGDRMRKIANVVWEPACGDGAMVKELERDGFGVIASDLIDRGCNGAELKSFYDWSLRPANILVTNPPYQEINARDGKGRWLRHALDLGVPYIAMFLNWDWPCAAGHAALLHEHPISRVYACRWKVDFTGKGAPPQRNAWFIWDSDWQGETALRFLSRNPEGQLLSMMEDADGIFTAKGAK